MNSNSILREAVANHDSNQFAHYLVAARREGVPLVDLDYQLTEWCEPFDYNQLRPCIIGCVSTNFDPDVYHEAVRGIGLRPGIYFNCSVDKNSEIGIPEIAAMIADSFARHAIDNEINYDDMIYDKIDKIDVGGNFSYSRSERGESGRFLFEENRENALARVIKTSEQLADLRADIRTFSKLISKNKMREFRISIPLWSMTSTISLRITEHWEGMSRRNRWWAAETWRPLSKGYLNKWRQEFFSAVADHHPELKLKKMWVNGVYKIENFV